MRFSLFSYSRQDILRLLGLALAYALAGRASLLLAIPPGYSIAVYPPAGIALGAILCGGYRLLPGVALGAFFVNLSIGLENSARLELSSVILPALIAGGAVLQAALSGKFIRRRLKDNLALDTDRAIFSFFLYGGILGCLISASVGVGALYALGVLSSAELVSNWLTWWTGDTLGVLTITPIVLTLYAQPRAIWHSRRWNVMLPLVFCLLVVIAAFTSIRQREEQKQQREFRLEAERISQNLQNTLNSHAEAVKNIERLYASSDQVGRHEFSTFVEYTLQNYPAISSLSWIPRLSRNQRSAFETAVAGEGYPNFHLTEYDAQHRLIAAAPRDDYYPVAYLEPFSADDAAFGYDMGSSAVRRNAIEDARDSGNLTATDPLPQERDPEKKLAVLLYAPVYAQGKPQDSMTQRKAAFIGAAVSTLQIGDVVRNLLSYEERKNVLIKFYDLSYPGEKGVFFDDVGKTDNKSLFQSTINFGGKQYALLAQPSPAYWKKHVSAITWITVVGGLLFTGLLGVYLLMATAHTFNVETLVAQRTTQLHDSEQRLRTVVDNAAEGIVTTDERGIIESANRSAEALLNYPKGALHGRNIMSLFPDPASRPFLVQYLSHPAGPEDELPAPQNCSRNEVSGKKLDGNAIPLELAVSRVKLGKQTLLVLILHDLSEKKRADKLKSEFVSAVSHELRTPLTSIRGVLGLLVAGVGGEISEQARSMLKMANDNAIRLTSQINDLLDFEKLEYGSLQFHLETLSLPELVQQALQANLGYAQNFDVSLQFHGAADDGMRVHVDARRFIQVLSNLLSNAVKFSHEHGRVDIRISQRADWARVEVQDYGIGISEEFKNSIFQKFTQEDAKAARRYAGTGLGLSLSRTMMEKMGGKIGFTSVEGQGSVFYVILPLATPSATVG